MSATADHAQGRTGPTGPTRGTCCGDMLRGLLPTLLLSVVAPIVTFTVLRNNGASDFTAYLWASLGPLVETVGAAIIKREADKVSILILAMTLISAIITVVGDTGPTMLLLKDSAMTGAFGIICLVTLLPVARRPLMYTFAQKFGGRGTEQGMEHFEDKWVQYPRFRRVFRILTAAWGVGYVLEAAVKVALAETVSFDLAYTLNQVLPVVVFVGLMTWTMWYSRRAQRRGEQRRAAAAQAAQAQAQPRQ